MDALQATPKNDAWRGLLIAMPVVHAVALVFALFFFSIKDSVPNPFVCLPLFGLLTAQTMLLGSFPAFEGHLRRG